MIVKNRNSIVLSKKNNQRSAVVNNARRRINNGTTTTTTTTPPPTPEDSDVLCLNLAPGLYKKKYEGYFYDNDDFFNSKLVGQISFADIGKTYRITDAGTATDQDWYSWGFFPQTEYDTPEALGLPFPSIGKGVFYDGFGSINNAGTASVSPILVSEEVTSQIDDYYYQSQGQNNKSLIIKGYFKPTVNGVYKFRLYSDDASYLWFGNDALDGNRITADAVVSLPGIHGPYHAEGIFSMVANSYYPLTVEFGNGPDGEGVLIFDYMPPGSNTWTSDLAGKLFYDIDSKGHRVCAPPSAYFGRVLSLDAVPYDENPNQISFDGAGVPTVNGVYVYTQTGSPLDSMFRGSTGFYGPVVNEENNFINLITEAGITGYFVRDWIENNYTYFNTGNIPFVNRVEVTNADFNVNDTYARLNSGDNTFLSINENNSRIGKNQNTGWNLIDDDDTVRYTNDDINLDPNGWYYDYTNTVTLNDFYVYEDGTVYTNKITINGAGTFDDTYTRVTSSDAATVDDNNINYIPFVNGTKTIASKGQTELNSPYGEASYDAFRGWYLYDSDISDPDFPRYGINTDDAIPTTLPAYTSVKSFRVSGLANIADDGVYSRSAGVNTPFTKAGSNPIVYEAHEEHGWKIWTYVSQQEQATHKLSNSAEITTGGWQRGFVDKIVFSGANNIANGTYIFQNQYAFEEENLTPILTVLGSGGTNEPRGWRIVGEGDQQGDTLYLQSPPQTTWWNGYEALVWYLDEDFGNPMGMQTVMTSQDRGLTWTSPYIYQFNLGGLPAPHTAYNKTYTFTSAGSLIPGCGGEEYISVNRIYYGNNMFYDIDANLWRLQFDYSYHTENDDTYYYIITLQKTGPSPVGTWTSINLLPCQSESDPLIIGGTIVGSNAIAISAGSGTLPTLSISEIEYVSGDANYSNPTLTSQITGDIISVDGTYTRNQGATTSLSNGTYTMYRPNGFNGGWIMDIPGAVNGGAAFNNDDFNLAENGWYETSPSVVGTASNTTARYYPANKTDGLLGIQYSGYFDNDPTWFNTASVKPIINELYLNHPTSDMLGPYIKVGDQNNQGTSYFQGTEANAGWAIYYHSAFPTSESYWYLQANVGPIHSKSNDLITWTMTPEAIEEYGDEGAPTTTITQTQNFENSTNFGVSRALSNDTSWQWVGYFRPQNTSDHSFNMYADENAYFWIGDKALNGYTTGNADMFSSGYIQATITDLALVSGVNYPVRMQWGHPANPTNAGLSLGYNDGINAGNNFSGLFFNFTGTPIATNSNGYVYDFTLGQWQVTNPAYEQVPDVYYSHVWLDSISGFNNSGVMYTGNKHVTLVNNPVYSSDYSGVYSFNGIDQYAITQEVPQSADKSVSHFTWFKPTGAGVVVSELGQPQPSAGWHDSQLEVMQDGKVNFAIWGSYIANPEFKIQSTGSIDFDRWYHLGLTYSSGVLSAYIDGQKIADSNCSSRLVPPNLYYGICAAEITNMGEGGFGKGSVGSFQVYNKGLTQTEVGNLYSGEKDRYMF